MVLEKEAQTQVANGALCTRGEKERTQVSS